MYRHWLLFVLILLLWSPFGCAPAGTGTEKDEAEPREETEAVHLHKGLQELAGKLIDSSTPQEIGRIGVVGFVGPGRKHTSLGKYISDKVSVVLFSSNVYPEFLERQQLKDIQQARNAEFSVYFNQDKVDEFGEMVGLDSMVIGNIKDLGSVIDVTAKIVESSSGRIQGIGDVRIRKGRSVRDLLNKAFSATLTISTNPPTEGSVVAGSKRGHLEQGIVTFQDVGYGRCRVSVYPKGFEPVSRTLNIRSREESVTINLEERRYDVSFQMIPPDTKLFVDGEKVEVNKQGFARLRGLEAGQYSYVARAKGYKSRMGIFNPGRTRVIHLDLPASDPFYRVRKKFFQKVRKIQRTQDFEVRLWTDRTHYRLGDTISFYFRAERDCYLNLVDINSRGEIIVLFPNRFHPDNYVRGGVTYRIPGEDYRFTFQAEPPTGTDRIYAVASTEPLDIFGPNFEKEAFLSMTRGHSRSLDVRGVGLRLEQSRLDSASECVIQVRE